MCQAPIFLLIKVHPHGNLDCANQSLLFTKETSYHSQGLVLHSHSSMEGIPGEVRVREPLKERGEERKRGRKGWRKEGKERETLRIIFTFDPNLASLLISTFQTQYIK